jgi:hypothetical protein
LDTLAHVDATPYTLDHSFLLHDEALLDEDPLEQIGVYTQRGKKVSGMLRFIWFNRAPNDLLSRSTADQDLIAQVDFARERNDLTRANLVGSVRLYEYPNGRGEGILGAYGQTHTKNPDISFDFSAFATRVGLGHFWTDIYEHAGEQTERRLEGSMDRLEAGRFATAMVKLAKDGL